jgi:hypothetical protein
MRVIVVSLLRRTRVNVQAIDDEKLKDKNNNT